MSKELNEAFVKNPTKFASEMPVVPPGGQAGNGETKTYSDMPDNFMGVPGSVRIVAADLEKKGSYAELKLSYAAVEEKITAGWMAIYWLPWIANHSIRTTLRPRSETHPDQQPKTGNRAVVKLTQTNGYQANPNDPEIFFTAAVDGCMVVVDGSPSQPTVYHANRKDHLTETELGAKDDERVTQMIKDVGKFKADRLKTPRGPYVTPVPPMGVTANMYMPFEKKSEWRNTTALIPEKDKKTFRKDMGAIFGFRHESLWQFWYERLLRFDHCVWEIEEVEDDDQPGVRNKVGSWDYKGHGFHLCELNQFWPDGKGLVIS